MAARARAARVVRARRASSSNDDLIAERYRGIRPAFGYPACPDHSEKRTLFELLGAEQEGFELTESFAMLPAASVSGIYFPHPEARYFSVGRIGRDQLEDYAARKGMSGRGGGALAPAEPRPVARVRRMSARVRLLALLGIFAALTATAAISAAGSSPEPKKAIKPAAQARAKRIAVGLRRPARLRLEGRAVAARTLEPALPLLPPGPVEADPERRLHVARLHAPDGLYVSSSVGIFRSAKQAQQAYALVVRPELRALPGRERGQARGRRGTSPCTRPVGSRSRGTATGRRPTASSSP